MNIKCSMCWYGTLLEFYLQEETLIALCHNMQINNQFLATLLNEKRAEVSFIWDGTGGCELLFYFQGMSFILSLPVYNVHCVPWLFYSVFLLHWTLTLFMLCYICLPLFGRIAVFYSSCMKWNHFAKLNLYVSSWEHMSLPELLKLLAKSWHS